MKIRASNPVVAFTRPDFETAGPHLYLEMEIFRVRENHVYLLRFLAGLGADRGQVITAFAAVVASLYILSAALRTKHFSPPF